MFHLLVKFDGWAPARDSIHRDRVFEYTEESVSARFHKADGTLDPDRLTRLPALFVAETGGTGDQQARIGNITRARLSSREVTVEYGTDYRIPPIPNSMLQRLAGELGIEPFEFARTHWAIKDVDLFRVLLRNQHAPLSPKVFKLDNAEGVDGSLLSVMMPFEARFDQVYAAIQEAAKASGMECLRASDIWEHDALIQDVVSLICKSRIVVCDCTGRNPNVFYEAGIAHTVGRDVILISQQESDIPFDLRHLRYQSYLDNNEGRRQLAERLEDRMRTLLQRPA